MAQLVFKDGSVVEAEGTFDEVLHRATREARERVEFVVILTDRVRLLVNPSTSADDGNKLVYGWHRNHEREAMYELEAALRFIFREAHTWQSRGGIRVAYVPNTKSELLTQEQAREYLGMIKSGYGGRWADRPKQKKIASP